jgi:hypothetical protein
LKDNKLKSHFIAAVFSDSSSSVADCDKRMCMPLRSTPCLEYSRQRRAAAAVFAALLRAPMSSGQTKELSQSPAIANTFPLLALPSPFWRMTDTRTESKDLTEHCESTICTYSLTMKLQMLKSNTVN